MGNKVVDRCINLERVIKPFPRLWVSSEQMEKTFNSGGPSQVCLAYQDYSKSAMTTHPGGLKKPRTTSKELLASLASIKVNVHDSTIRKRLSKNGIHGRVPRQKSLLTKNNTKASLTFAKIYLDCSQDFWANTDVTKVKLFGRCVSCYIWRKTNRAFHTKNIIPKVKHGGASVMFWGCFAFSEPGRLAIIDGTINSAVYQTILKENVRLSVCDLKLKRTWVMQQDNDPKHTSKSTSELLKKNKGFGVAKSKSGRNLIEMLWHDLK